MSETDARLQFDDPPDGRETDPISDEVLSRSTSSASKAGVTDSDWVQEPNQGQFEPGVQIGPYLLISKLGEGGMGVVFKATHTKLDKTVAIKILPSASLNQKTALARFEREMKAVGRLQHPNVVQAFDAGDARGTHYLVMEYVEGTDLQKLVMKRGVFTIPNACRAIHQAALGLAAAHEMGLVHRDVKPSNLFVSRAGVIKILDLGLARLSQDEGDTSAITHSGQCFGTPEYMAPEQWEDVHTCDGRTDLYALGCTLFFLLTGRPPYGGEEYKTAPKKMLGHIKDAIPSLRALRGDVPVGLEDIYLKLMAKKCENRFATAAELVEAISPWIDGAEQLENLSVTRVKSPSQPASATAASHTVPSTSPPEPRIAHQHVTQEVTRGQPAKGPKTQPVLGDEQTVLALMPNLPEERSKPRLVWLYVGGLAAVLLAVGITVVALQFGRPAANRNTLVEDDPPAISKVPDPFDPQPDPEIVDRRPPVRPIPEDDEPPVDALTVIRAPAVPVIVQDDGPPLDPAFADEELIVGPIEMADPEYPPLPEMPGPEPVPAIVLADLPGRRVAPQPEVPTVEPDSEPLEPLFVAKEIEIKPPQPPDNRPALLKAPFDEVAARNARQKWAEHLKIEPSVKNSIGLELVLVPPGEFAMGASELEAKPKDDERPQHRVVISKPFYVGKYEVLQGEYEKVTGRNPSKFNRKTKVETYRRRVAGQDTDLFPVDSVSWVEARDFCNALSEKEGLDPFYKATTGTTPGNGYRLLTEAEWEYACRAGTETSFSFGSGNNGKEANVNGSKPFKMQSPGPNLNRTTRRGSYPPNSFGLYDFHGNVNEWCGDVYDPLIYTAATGRTMIDPTGPNVGKDRVLRGGGWESDGGLSRSSARARFKPTDQFNSTGFRIARPVPVEDKTAGASAKK